MLSPRTHTARTPRRWRAAARVSSFVLAGALAAGAAAPAGPVPAGQGNDARRAAIAVAALQASYGPRTYKETSFWQSAAALRATIDYMRASGSRAYLSDLDTAYRAHARDRFLNRYYDDEGWWALTWISAYLLTGQTRYLDQARLIFADMTTGWDSACGGGIWWSKARTYKNAIANELFLAVAVGLRNLTGDAGYAAWAQREWAWFRGSGMITSAHLVVDGLAACAPILDSPTWTYNQGVLIGALAGLGDGDALRTAREIAEAVITSPRLSPRGILREPCEASGSCNTDQRIFKGMFSRGLKALYDRVGDPRYRAYLRANAASVWRNDRQGAEFGLSWAGPFDRAGTAGQVAAVDLLTTQIG
jgi:predicted alpha-1,6-mannanase (GH76 family)